MEAWADRREQKRYQVDTGQRVAVAYLSNENDEF